MDRKVIIAVGHGGTDNGPRARRRKEVAESIEIVKRTVFAKLRLDGRIATLALAIAAVAIAALIAPASSFAAPSCDSPDPPPICAGESRGFFQLGYEPDPEQQRGALKIVVRGGIVESGVDYNFGTPIYVYPDAQPAIKLRDYGEGFETTVPAGTRTICVYSRMPRGQQSSVSLGCKGPNVMPFGTLEAVTLEGSQVRLRGWAIDPETSSPIDVHFYADGNFAGGARADQDAKQIEASRTAIWGSRHGFDTVLPASAAKGEHTVCAYAINAGAGDVNPQLEGCRTYLVVGPPSAPSGISLRQPDGERHATLAVSWLDHADDETGFRIVRTRNGVVEPAGPPVGALAGTGRRGERVDGGLAPGTRYCYRVIAVNEHGESAPSAEACLSTLQSPPPAATNLSIVGRTTTSVTLAWSDNAADETGNRVVAERSDGFRTSTAVGPQAGIGRRTTVLGGLASGKEHCLTVVVEKAGHENSVSQRLCVRTKAAGSYLLSLSRQSSTSFIYNADAINGWDIPDNAVITTVKNSSFYNYSLAHGGPGSPFVILPAGETTSAWAGQLLEQGTWSAQYSGALSWAPSSLGVTVNWIEP